MSQDTTGAGPVLIAYDGSDFAKNAIAEAGRELRPERGAIVLTVWELLGAIPFLGAGGAPTDPHTLDEIVTETERGADAVAGEGAQLAIEAGFRAVPMTVSGQPSWWRIVETAEAEKASIIVLGSHGRTGLRYALIGSVAAAVAQHSKTSVMIVHRRT